jgi:RNA polymerase sigma-B factor
MTATAASPSGLSSSVGAPAGTVQLFERWQCDGDELARRALVERFMPLARSLTRRYGRSSEPFEDLC